MIEHMVLDPDGMSYALSVSAYADLISVYDMGVVTQPDAPNYQLMLTGSGGGIGSWEAFFSFEDEWLIERYVTSDNFRDEAFARTFYGRPTDN